MAWRCNNVESLLLDLYGNESNWIDFSNGGIIDMDYNKKLKLIDKLILDVKSNNLGMLTDKLFEQSFENDVYNTLHDRVLKTIEVERKRTEVDIRRTSSGYNAESPF